MLKEFELFKTDFLFAEFADVSVKINEMVGVLKTGCMTARKCSDPYVFWLRG